MKKSVTGFAIVGLLGVLSFSFASKPANPGCFGQDRASIIKEVFIDGDGTGEFDGPGASGWGALAADRAETNGQQNRDYRTSCGGDSN